MLDDSISLPLLHLASGMDLPKTMERLLKEGAKVTSRDNCGMTALHHALAPSLSGRSSASPQAIALLLKSGASIFARGDSGDTSMDLFSHDITLRWEDPSWYSRRTPAHFITSTRDPEEVAARKKIGLVLEGKAAAMCLATLGREREIE